MSDATLSTLGNIRTKVRRLTKSPSSAQLTDADIDSYVNTFVLYDIPSSLTINSLKSTLKFYTDPYVERYSTNTTVTTDPLYNFKNKYNLSSNNVTIAGRSATFSESRSDFYDIYPNNSQLVSIGTGDGVTTLFAGTLTNIPFLSSNVTFTSVNTANQGLAAYDDGLGAFSGDAAGTINYVTGVYSLTFTSAPKSGVTVYAQIVPYTPAIPDTILFYQDEFWVRPVPDQPYCIEIEVSIRPTELLSGTEMPDLTQWWQYIAIGAARKILIDRLDFETANMLEAEFNDQESKILYRTVIQNSSRR
jgi:hypothetical protein